MTKKLSKRNPQSQSQSTQPHTRAGSPQLTTATDTTNTSPVGITAALHSVVSLLVVLATIYTGYYLGRYLASLSVSPSLSAYRSAVDFEEHNVVRVHAGIPMLFLKEKNEPRVLLNTYISKEVPRWTAADIAHLMTTPEITGVYRSNQSAIFGTFYDNNRPMRTLPTVHNSIRYEKNVTLTKQTLAATFPPHSTDSRAPHHILATALATIDPSLETRMDIRELISLNPSKSAVNLWMSSPGSVTPCHFDGYYNMYVLCCAVLCCAVLCCAVRLLGCCCCCYCSYPYPCYCVMCCVAPPTPDELCCGQGKYTDMMSPDSVCLCGCMCMCIWRTGSGSCRYLQLSGTKRFTLLRPGAASACLPSNSSPSNSPPSTQNCTLSLSCSCVHMAVCGVF